MHFQKKKKEKKTEKKKRQKKKQKKKDKKKKKTKKKKECKDMFVSHILLPRFFLLLGSSLGVRVRFLREMSYVRVPIGV